MNNGKHYPIYLTLDEIEKVKKVLPHIEYQLEKLFSSARRSPSSFQWYMEHRKEIIAKRKKSKKVKKRKSKK